MDQTLPVAQQATKFGAGPRGPGTLEARCEHVSPGDEAKSATVEIVTIATSSAIALDVSDAVDNRNHQARRDRTELRLASTICLTMPNRSKCSAPAAPKDRTMTTPDQFASTDLNILRR